MKAYYYTDGKTNYGPFTADELKGQNLTHETFVWTDSFPEWKRLKDVPELRDMPGAIPPLLGNEQNPSRRWIDILLLCSLAFWLIDSIISRLMPFMFDILGFQYMRYYSYIQLFLSIILSVVPIVVAYSIQNKMFKTIGLVISMIIAIITIAGGIFVMIQIGQYSNY